MQHVSFLSCMFLYIYFQKDQVQHHLCDELYGTQENNKEAAMH